MAVDASGALVCDPEGGVVAWGSGAARVERKVQRITLVGAGSGVTPMLQIAKVHVNRIDCSLMCNSQPDSLLGLSGNFKEP